MLFHTRLLVQLCDVSGKTLTERQARPLEQTDGLHPACTGLRDNLPDSLSLILQLMINIARLAITTSV